MSYEFDLREIEPVVRVSVFCVVLLLMAAWEWYSPRRPRSLSRQRRWPANLALLALDTLIVRAIFPATIVGIAISLNARGFGLFNWINMPGEIAVLLGIVLLDLAVYLQHVVFHHVPVLWRLHRMHHADLDMDVTTGGRFHPIEIVLSMLLKCTVTALLGIPAVAVIVFEVLLNATSTFNHSNVNIPLNADRWLRAFIVTPDMHRIHHSVERDETDSNFAFNFAIWDRVFGTYRAQPRAGQLDITIGIAAMRDPERCNSIGPMLRMPFAKTVHAG